MNPKKIPFTDAYVKEQQSTLSRGYNLFAALAVVVLAVGIILIWLDRESTGLITMAMILAMWGAFSKQRLNTFRENLELSKMIQQLRSAPEPGKGAKE